MVGHFVFTFDTKPKKTGYLTMWGKRIPTYDYLFTKLKGDYYILITQLIPEFGERGFEIKRLGKTFHNRLAKFKASGAKPKLIGFAGTVLYSDVFLHIPLFVQMGMIKELEQLLANSKEGFITMYGTKANPLPFTQYYTLTQIDTEKYMIDLLKYLTHHPLHKSQTSLLYNVEVPVYHKDNLVGYIPLMQIDDSTEVVYKEGLFTRDFIKTVYRFFGRGQWSPGASYYRIQLNENTYVRRKPYPDLGLTEVRLDFESPMVFINSKLRPVYSLFKF